MTSRETQQKIFWKIAFEDKSLDVNGLAMFLGEMLERIEKLEREK
jgi:hypothetical protein